MNENYGIRILSDRLDELQEILEQMKADSTSHELDENPDYLNLQQKVGELLHVLTAFDDSVNMKAKPVASVTYVSYKKEFSISGEMLLQTSFGVLIRVDDTHDLYIQNQKIRDIIITRNHAEQFESKDIS